MNKKIGIVWLKNDFRLTKNLALSHATRNHDFVSALYIYKKNDFDKKREAQKWWLYKSLKNFQKKLNIFNINLEFVSSNSYEEIFNKIIKNKSCSLYWNKTYEPKYLKFDKLISQKLKEKEIDFKIFKGNILNEVQEVKKKDNTPFKVFTPYWRTAELFYLEKVPAKIYITKKQKQKKIFFKSKDKFDDILPDKNWHKKFDELWDPSEEEAVKVCKKFIKDKINKYGETRDFPNVQGTSKISPFLSFGQIHIESIWELCSQVKVKQSGFRKYINELGWREFSHSLINFFPEMLKNNLRKEFNNFPWVDNKIYLDAWKKGKTGYPIVDAGMRELFATGWMHNRVRMITASFLVKHLRINWKEGEKHFRNCLLDFNEANNVAGWQWVSGSGADAAPYFRIFNPILQGERFDKTGEYVKKWVPELSKIPKEFIHKPWEMTNQIDSFNLGKDYPLPIVQHKEAREAALNAFKEIKKIK